MKILLIYPSVTVYGPSSIEGHFPMGLAYIAATLEKEHKVVVLDALAEGGCKVRKIKDISRAGLSDAKIREVVRRVKPDVVGISMMFTAFADDGYRVAKLVKGVNRKIVTVVGGAHVSIDPKAVLKDGKSIDYAIKGEGEITIIELLNNLGKKDNLKNIDGLTYRENKKIIQNKNRTLVKDLDIFPFPARHLFKTKLYSSGNKFAMRYPVFPIVSSRGCPNHCLYCSVNSIWGNSWRGRSPKNVVDEIEFLMKEYGAKEISFLDDSMSLDRDRMTGICDELLKRKVKIKWTTPNGIAHWTLDKEILRKMKKAGCYRITFGIESGNLEMRKWVGKPFSLDQAKELTQYANKIGMWTLSTNIIGFPYETRSQIDDTVNYAINSDVDLALFFRLSPKPGTPIYEIFKNEGWLIHNKNRLFSELVACQTQNFSSDELYEIQNESYKKFIKSRIIRFMNPLRLMSKIKSFEDFIYVSRLGFSGLKLVLNLLTAEKGVTSKTLKV